MYGLAILLIELGTDALKNRLQLFDIDVARIIDVTTSEKLVVSDSSILEDLQQLEHGPVLERNIVVRAIVREVLFSALSVGLESAVEFLDGDISFHVFVQDESQPRDLTSTELKLEIMKH